MIIPDSDPWAHTKAIGVFFGRLREYNLKLSPSKARLGVTTDAEFQGHSISPAGLPPNAQKVSVLTLIPMPSDHQPRFLLGGLSHYRKFPGYVSKRIEPITDLLQKGVKCVLTPATEVIIRELLAGLSAPSVVVFPDWDAVEDGSRSVRVYCDASIDCFGATLVQEQPDGLARPIAYIIRATLDSERHWAPLDLETGRLHCLGQQTSSRLPVYLWGTKFRISSDHKVLEEHGKVIVGGDHNVRVQRWLDFVIAFEYTLEYRKSSANRNSGFLSRPPQPALITAALGLLDSPPRTRRPYTSPVPGIGSGGLVPRPEDDVLGGLLLTPSDFRNFGAHGPHLRIDDLSAPLGRFVARVCVLDITGDCRPGRSTIYPSADTAFALFFSVLLRISQLAPLPTSSAQDDDSAAIVDLAAFASFPPDPSGPADAGAMASFGRISTLACRQTAAATGTAQPFVDCGLGPGGTLRSSVRRAGIPTASCVPTTVFGRRFGPTPSSNACPYGTYSVRPRPRRDSGSPAFATPVLLWPSVGRYGRP